MDDHKQHVIEALAVKNAPPVTVASLTLFGVHVHDYLVVITIAWVLVQMGFFLFDRWKKRND